MLTARRGISDEHPRYSPDGRVIAYHALRHRSARSTTRATSRWSSGTAARTRARTAARPRARTLHGAPDSRARSCSRPRIAGASGCTGSPLARRAAGALVARAARSAASRARATARASPSTAHGAAHPPALFARAATAAASARSSRLNDALLARHALGEMREFTVKGWDGEPVQMWRHLSAGLRPGEEVAAAALDPRRPARRAPRRLPLPLEHARVRRRRATWSSCVNYHGSSGFGQKFLESITGRYGEKEFADIEAATDFMLRRATSTASGWWPPAAATAASWSRA